MGRAASWGLSWLRLAASNPAADFKSCCHRWWVFCFYVSRLQEDVPQMGPSGGAWWACEGLADGGCPGDECLAGSGSRHTNTWWSFLPVPAAVPFPCWELPCAGWWWWPCSHTWWPRLQLWPQEFESSALHTRGCRRGKKMQQVRWVLLPQFWKCFSRFKKSKMLVSGGSETHIPPQSKTKPHQNSIRWRRFPGGFHFSGRQSVPFYFPLLLEQKGFEWRIWSSCHVGVCSLSRMQFCVYTELEKSKIGEKHSKLNFRSKFLASPDGIRVLRIMPDMASEVNFLVHLLISCQQVLRQGSQWPRWFPFPPQVFFHAHSSPQG